MAMEPKSYPSLMPVAPGESMRMDENSFQDRVEGFSHKIVLVNKTNRRLHFYGTAEGAHGFELGGSWVKCSEVIIRITEAPESKKPFWRRLLDRFTFEE